MYLLIVNEVPIQIQRIFVLSNPLNILLVEDELIIALMMQQMIRRLGHQVVAAVTTGREAVEAALKHKPDLILMDIRLEGEMDGIDAMNKIAEQQQTPVIFVTGNSDQGCRGRISRLQHRDVLIKPVAYHELNRSVSLVS